MRKDTRLETGILPRERYWTLESNPWGFQAPKRDGEDSAGKDMGRDRPTRSQLNSVSSCPSGSRRQGGKNGYYLTFIECVLHAKCFNSITTNAHDFTMMGK